jgi:hypothetical protein
MLMLVDLGTDRIPHIRDDIYLGIRQEPICFKARMDFSAIVGQCSVEKKEEVGRGIICHGDVL